MWLKSIKDSAIFRQRFTLFSHLPKNPLPGNLDKPYKKIILLKVCYSPMTSFSKNWSLRNLHKGSLFNFLIKTYIPHMKNHLQILLFCLLFPLSSTAQSSPVIDSLILSLSTESQDTLKVKTLNAIATQYRNIDLEAAENYANQAYQLAQASKQHKEQLLALYSLGVISRMQGDMDDALAFGKRGLNLASNSENWRWCGSNSSALGNTYSSLGVFDTAMIYYIKAVNFYEQGKYPVKIANVYNNMGNMLYKQKKDGLAIEYLQKALKIYKDHGQIKRAAMTFMNLGRREKNDSLAMNYFSQALAIHTENKDVQGIASVSMNIGSRLMRGKNYEAARPYYLEGLRLTTQVGHKAKMATANSSLGKIHYALNQPEEAIRYYEAAIALSEAAKFKEEEQQTYNNLSLLYAQQGDHRKAYESLKQSRDIGEVMVNEKNLAFSTELEAKFDAKQKEAELAKQQLIIEQQKNTRNLILAAGILLLLAITAIFQRYFYHQKRKKQAALLALEKEKVAAKNLRELDTLKTKFFANISHELKTPLAMVISPLEEALILSSDDNLVLAHHNSKKLYRLVNEILDLSKLEAGQVELRESEVMIHPLVRRIFFAFQTLAQRRNIELKLLNHLAANLTIHLDVEKFEKILNNLLSNAIKFSKPGSTVELKTTSSHEAPEQLFFEVKDEGDGIDPNDIEKVFDRFYQSSSGKISGGTGIGLALSKELAQLFNGSLKVSSQLGQGSIFTLSIPLKKAIATNHQARYQETTTKLEPSTSLPPQQSYQAILLDGKKPNILIVEDNLEMSDFLTRILSPHYQCKTALDGKEALEQLQHSSFDLITSDLMMPEMDGFSFRKAINEQASLKHTPFIMLTASAFEADKLEGLRLGVDDYITKPFSSRELIARINNLLKNKIEREAEQAKNQEAVLESVDQQFLKQAEQVVIDHLHDPDFKVADLAKAVGYSQRQLARIIKRLTGLSPVSFILEVRLQKAYHLFQSRQFATVSEIRYEIGIESAAYFTTKFKERFGKSPKEFLV